MIPTSSPVPDPDTTVHVPRERTPSWVPTEVKTNSPLRPPQPRLHPANAMVMLVLAVVIAVRARR